MAFIERALARTKPGRGTRFVKLVEFVVADIKGELQIIVAGAENDPPTGNFREIRIRQLVRIKALLAGLHELAATYRQDVGRDDVPVGLQYLVDVLIADIMPVRKDPLIHMSTSNMYSTQPLGLIAERLTPNGQKLPADFLEPVVFNFPALDPANMMLSPVLAHEVGHTAVWQKLWPELISQWDGPGLNRLLSDNFAKLQSRTNERTDDWADRFGKWCRELLCDAIALTLTGPSYMFALASFLPAPATPPLGTHPYPRDRIAYCMRFLQELGWGDFLDARVPNVRRWADALAADPVLDGSPQETFLREATELVEPLVSRLGREHISSPLEPGAASQYLDDAIEMLTLGVPPCAAGGETLDAWEIVLSGWTFAMSDDTPRKMGLASESEELNALLTKTLELSSVANLWLST